MEHSAKVEFAQTPDTGRMPSYDRTPHRPPGTSPMTMPWLNFLRAWRLGLMVKPNGLD